MYYKIQVYNKNTSQQWLMRHGSNKNGKTIIHYSEKLIKVDRSVERTPMKTDVQEPLKHSNLKRKKIEVNSGTHNFHKHLISYLFY